MQGHRRLRLWGSQSGFTLIELLGVMVIVLLLSLVAVSVFINITEKVRLSASSGKLTELEKALERYQVDKGHYPISLAKLVEDNYLRAAENGDEPERNPVFVSPWYDDDEDPKYFYYAVPEDEGAYPKRFLLVDPSPRACLVESDFCLHDPAHPDDLNDLDTDLISELDGGWRSSGNWN